MNAHISLFLFSQPTLNTKYNKYVLFHLTFACFRRFYGLVTPPLTGGGARQCLFRLSLSFYFELGSTRRQLRSQTLTLCTFQEENALLYGTFEAVLFMGDSAAVSCVVVCVCGGATAFVAGCLLGM